MQKSAILINALLDGKTLERNCARPDSDYYHDRSQMQTLHCEKWGDNKNHFYMNGWGTAYGTVEDRLLSVIKNPELWEVAHIEEPVN